MGYSLVCSECRGRTPFHPPEAGKPSTYPRFCSHCGVDTRSPADDGEVSCPAFLSAKTKATDQHYRDHERGSEVRMHAAAELAGVPASEMSDMKITNLNDRRDAEIAAMPVVNDITKFMENTKIGGFQGPNGSEYAGGVRTGPYPNRGSSVLRTIQGG